MVKCATLRSFSSLVLCAILVGEVAVKSVRDESAGYAYAPTAAYDGLATRDNDTEGPTSSSDAGIIIGDTSSINYVGMLVRHDDSTYLHNEEDLGKESQKNGGAVMTEIKESNATTPTEEEKYTTQKDTVETTDNFYWLDSNQYDVMEETEDTKDSEETTSVNYENNDDLNTTTNPDNLNTEATIVPTKVETTTEIKDSIKTYTKEKLLIKDEDNQGGKMSKMSKESEDAVVDNPESTPTNTEDNFLTEETEKTVYSSTSTENNNAAIENDEILDERKTTYTSTHDYTKEQTTALSTKENIGISEGPNAEGVSSTTETDLLDYTTEKTLYEEVYSTNKDSVDITTSYTEPTRDKYQGNSFLEELSSSTERNEDTKIPTNNFTGTTEETGYETTSSSDGTTVRNSEMTESQKDFVTEEVNFTYPTTLGSSEDINTTTERESSVFETGETLVTPTTLLDTISTTEIIQVSTNNNSSTNAEESFWVPTTLFTFSTTETTEKTTEIPMIFKTDIPAISESVTTAVLTTTSEKTTTCKDVTITKYHIDMGKTELQVKWNLHSEVLYDSCRLKINISCSSADGDKSAWVVTQKSNSTDVVDDEPVSFLKNLSEYTNYSCVGLLMMDADEDGQVLSSETFNATTLPEVPSDIKFSVRNVTSKSFSLTWKRPEKIPGNLLNYHILIKAKGSHKIRDDCRSSEISGITISFFSDRKYLFHSFEMAQPNHVYEVQILAQDEAGNSTGMAQEVLTRSSPSTEPLNVKSVLQSHTVHCNKDSYNTTLQLIWEWPCNTNGELKRFEINISEVVHRDSDRKYTGNNYTYKVSKISEKERFHLIVENLNASCSYEVTIVAVTGEDLHGVPAKHTTEKTEVGCPSKPSKITAIPTGSNFILEWEEPEKFYGEILDYTVLIPEAGPKHNLSRDPSCQKYQHVPIELKTNLTSFKFDTGLPNFFYRYMVVARTAAGLGEPSEIKEVVTHPEASEPVRDLQMIKVDEIVSYERYEYKVRLNFKEPCNTNGFFRYYTIEERGTRFSFPDFFNITNSTETSYEAILEKPEYHYEFAVSVVTENGISPVVSKKITTSASIPMVNRRKITCYTDEEGPTIIKLELEEGVFDDDNGVIVHYGIYLYEGVEKNSITEEPSFGIWNRNDPDVNKTTYPLIEAAHIYQITDRSWNPFTGKINKITINIGKKDNCNEFDFCQALSENTNYIILFRGFTKTTYRDVFLSIKTGIKPSSANLYLILLVVLVVILLIAVYVYSKKPQIFSVRFRSVPDASVEEAIPRHLVAVKNFIGYYNKTLNDPLILRKQYEEIEDEIKKYKEENVHTTFALKPENKRKNRYTNILPYDEYRVKLNIDEDDEICTDYINASYIRGVSGEVEYIATQGPLEHTCKDFWKMVIQENITVIVMVSQFVEKEKEKCFKYFPNNHENMMICEDLEVKCLTELQFDTYCVRTLMIRKDVKQFSVIHMQYLDWPDFGCPSGTFNMLSFCEEVRERIQIEKGLMAVHCSAGVGRTGTLISLDILLQTMRRKKEISVFECVMDLRKQRTHMVQTEKQYVYIHTCLKDVLENSSLYAFDETKKNEEHIYENIKKEKVKGSKCNDKERESAF